jgi:hypothetical protein
MLNLPSNKLCKLKSRWQHEGGSDSWILVYPTFAKTDGSCGVSFDPLMAIGYKFCLVHSAFGLNFRIDDTLFVVDNGDWILDKPTAENMLMLGRELKETNRYVYNLKTKELIDKNPPLELPF